MKAERSTQSELAAPDGIEGNLPKIVSVAFSDLDEGSLINHLIAAASNINLLRGKSGKLAQSLTMRELRALGVLKSVGPKTVRQLARICELDPSNISRTVTTLVERKLLAKVDNPEHKQAQFICLTKAGARLYDQHRRMIEEGGDVLLSNFTRDEQTQLRTLLERYVANARLLSTRARRTPSSDAASED